MNAPIPLSANRIRPAGILSSQEDLGYASGAPSGVSADHHRRLTALGFRPHPPAGPDAHLITLYRHPGGHEARLHARGWAGTRNAGSGVQPTIHKTHEDAVSHLEEHMR